MLTINISEIKAILSYLFTLIPDKKIEQIKALRAMTGYGLMEAKNLVEAEWERRNERPCPITRELTAIRERQRVVQSEDRAFNPLRAY